MQQTDTFIDSSYELYTDGGTRRVRQKAMRADAINGNGRLYPSDVVRKALMDARSLAYSGAMLSNYVHPRVAKVGQEEVFEDRPFDKTARVDNIMDPDSDGWVVIERTILPTEQGKRLLDRLEKRDPPGLSTRFRMKGHYAQVDGTKIKGIQGNYPQLSGKRVHVADSMEIHTWDDVEMPAFSDAGKEFQILSDSLQVSTQPSYNLPVGDLWMLIEDGIYYKFEDVHQLAVWNPAISSYNYVIVGPNSEAHLLSDSLDNDPQPLQMTPEWYEYISGVVTKVNRRLKSMGGNTPKVDANIAGAPLQGYNPDGVTPTMTEGGATGDPGGGWGQTPGDPTVSPVPGMPDPAGFTNTYMPDMVNNYSPTQYEDSNLSIEDLKYIREKRNREQLEGKRKQYLAAVDTAIAKLMERDDIKQYPEDVRKYICGRVRGMTVNVDDIPKLFDREVEAFSRLMSNQRLNVAGITNTSSSKSGPKGFTTTDTVYQSENGFSTMIDSESRGKLPASFAEVEKLCVAIDNERRFQTTSNASDPAVKSLRKYNMQNVILPLIEEMVQRDSSKNSIDQWFRASDHLLNRNEQAFMDSMKTTGYAPSVDAMTTGSFFNQPTIASTLLIQQFQDMEALQFVQALGPGLDTGAGGFQLRGSHGDGRIGSVLRLPIELYTAPTGYGMQGYNYDGGLLVPELTGINESSVTTMWLEYAPVWRRIATSMTRDVIKSMGNGPLNYPLVGRAIFHMVYDVRRRIDLALMNEMLATSDEYNAAMGSDSTATATVLSNNSASSASGTVTVNLNPNSTAVTAPASTDPYAVYAASGGGAVGAIRLTAWRTSASAPYFGQAPVTQTRNVNTLNSQGQISTNTYFPVNVNPTTALAPVEGWINDLGVLTPIAGQTTVDYAVDWMNGVIVFNSSFFGTGSAPFATPGGSDVVIANNTGDSVALYYWYATNYDTFVVNNPTLATGETLNRYYSQLFYQIDQTAALMASAPRYVSPNLALMSVGASPYITSSDIFYQLNNPTGTSMFPTNNFFFERTGIMGARFNAPWRARNSRILLTRKGTTKYGIDSPLEIRGPLPSYDNSTVPLAVPRDIYYAEEYSVIATPQVKNMQAAPPSGYNSTNYGVYPAPVINPVSRSIILR